MKNYFSLQPLICFLKKETFYFTSLGLFIALLALTLFIEKTGDYKTDFFILILQGSVLLLTIILLTPIIIKNITKPNFWLRIFTLLISLSVIGLIGLMWYAYRDSVRLFIYLIIGALGLNLKTQKTKNKILIFFTITILIINLYLIFKGEWISQLSDLNKIPTKMILIYRSHILLFLGYLVGIFLFLLEKIIYNFFKPKP